MVTTIRAPQVGKSYAGRIGGVIPGARISVEGRVVRKTIPPPDLRPLAKVRIDDGSGQIILILPGRRVLQDVPLGAVVRAEGVVGGREKAIPTMFDPAIKVVSEI